MEYYSWALINKKPNVRGRTREVMKGGNKWQNIYAHPNDKLQS